VTDPKKNPRAAFDELTCAALFPDYIKMWQIFAEMKHVDALIDGQNGPEPVLVYFETFSQIMHVRTEFDCAVKYSMAKWTALIGLLILQLEIIVYI
jgi:hypothetical protein